MTENVQNDAENAGEDALSQLQARPSNAPRFTPMQGALWLLGIIIAVYGAYVLAQRFDIIGQSSGRGDPFRIGGIARDVREGQYDAAVQKSTAIQNDPNASIEQKARALLVAIGAEYRITGDMKERLEDIAEMKKYIVDPAVSIQTRVDLINILAAQYPISGGDARIFEETYKGEPFASFKATSEANTDRNARLSSRNLFDWSYSTMPTAFAAISIARWYSEQYSFDQSLSAAQKEEYANRAAEYLEKAESAATAEEGRIGPAYRDSTAYLTYRHWRAVTIGRLRAQIGEPYKSQYAQEYEDLFAFEKAQNNKLASEYLLYSRMFFASQLRGDGKTEYAKQQLDTLASEMNAVQNPDVNVFFSFLRNEFNERPAGATYVNLISSNFELSPAFEAAVMKVVLPQ